MSRSRGSKLLRQFATELDLITFFGGVSILLATVGSLVIWPSRTSKFLNELSDSLLNSFGWIYLLIMIILTIFILFLIFGPWGSIKLGKESDEPEFGFFSYFAMLYSAGLASGIVFWGPAEAINHFETVPPVIDAESQSMAAAIGAVQYSIFHWGAASWIPHVIIGISVAFYAYRKDAPMRVSTVLTPLIGLDNLDGFLAKMVDILAVFAVIGGVATTLGFVGSQLLSGITFITGTAIGDLETIAAITGLTILFTISVSLGVERGILRVSNFNMILFPIIMILVFILGVPLFVANLTIAALGDLISQYATMSFHTGVGSNSQWLNNWTLFYWGWVFSWAPFVGLFIARISRGRTVRQVAATGVGASTAVAIPWFGIMGSTAIRLQQTGAANILNLINEFGVSVSVYPLLKALPFGNLLTVLFLILVVTFFVTSADSSTLALGMLTTGGKRQPSTINRVIWGSFMGALAALLFVNGGTSSLQTASIITGGPFGIILVVAVAAMIASFREIHPIFSQDKISEAPSDSSTRDTTGESTSTRGASSARED